MVSAVGGASRKLAQLRCGQVIVMKAAIQIVIVDVERVAFPENTSAAIADALNPFLIAEMPIAAADVVAGAVVACSRANCTADAAPRLAAATRVALATRRRLPAIQEDVVASCLAVIMEITMAAEHVLVASCLANAATDAAAKVASSITVATVACRVASRAVQPTAAVDRS